MKRVLFITYDYPYPTNTGGKNRAYHMLKYSGSEFEKYLFSFVRKDFNEQYIKDLERIDVKVVGLEPRKKVASPKNALSIVGKNSIFRLLYFSDKVLSKIIEVVENNKIDIVHFESFYAGFYISDRLKKLGVKQVFGTENVEYTLYEDYAKKSLLPMKPFLFSQVGKIKKEEAEMCRSADVCVAVSESDQDEISKYNKCKIVRNGVDIAALKYNAPRKEVNNLLFIGNFSYFPNVDAIEFFSSEVFKRLEQDITLTIVGKQIGKLKLPKDTRIKLIEYVEDIREVYLAADIMVAPIRIGGGTNFKILEAMASGVPVISLPERLVGLKVENNKNIFVAKDAAQFIEVIKIVSSDYDLRKKVSENARKLVEEEYSWEAIGDELSKVWNSVLSS